VPGIAAPSYRPLFCRKPPLGQGASGQSSLAKGAALILPLNEGGGSQVYDASGNGNTGTYAGTVSWRPSKFGTAPHFVGALPTGINCGNGPAFQITGDISIGGWFFADFSTSSNIWMAKDKDTGGRSWTLDCNNDAALRWYINGGAGGLATGPNLATATWYHLVGTWQQSTKLLVAYVNGQAVAAATGSDSAINTSTANVTIGYREFSGSENPWDGLAELCFVFPYRLTTRQVQSLYINPTQFWRRRAWPAGVAAAPPAQTPTPGWWFSI
jgi:hypothetical protein